MSAQTMAKMGEKTRKQIMGKLGKRPKSPGEIASAVGKSTDYVRAILVEASKKGLAVVERDGRALKYRAAEAPTISGTSKRAKATGVASTAKLPEGTPGAYAR